MFPGEGKRSKFFFSALHVAAPDSCSKQEIYFQQRGIYKSPASGQIRETDRVGCFFYSSINNISFEATHPLQNLNATPRLCPTYINVFLILKPISFGPLLDPSQVGHSDEILSQINKLIMLIYWIRLTVEF